MAKKRVMITLDEDLINKMEQVCEFLKISKSAYISLIASKDYKVYERVYGPFNINQR